MSQKLEIDCMIACPDWRAHFDNLEKHLRRVLEAGVEAVPDLWESPARAWEVSIVMTDDAAVQTLSRNHLGKDKPTNVLSFPQSGPYAPDRRPLGDIILAYHTVEREAGEQRKSIEAHAAHLTLHGLFHLLGFDHQTDDEAHRMETLERQALSTLGYDDPYTDDQRQMAVTA